MLCCSPLVESSFAASLPVFHGVATYTACHLPCSLAQVSLNSWKIQTKELHTHIEAMTARTSRDLSETAVLHEFRWLRSLAKRYLPRSRSSSEVDIFAKACCQPVRISTRERECMSSGISLGSLPCSFDCGIKYVPVSSSTRYPAIHPISPVAS